VALFNFVGWIVVALAAIAVLWPLNIPLMALAYKVRHGAKAIPLETQEFWLRSTFAALSVALLTLVFLGSCYLLIVGAELEEAKGGVELLLLMGYVPVAVVLLTWIFALEDLLEALSLFAIYVLLPGLPLFLIGWLFKLGPKIADWKLTGWLVASS
jgi:hypothetical protein